MIEFQNEVYDLKMAGLRKMLHTELDEAFGIAFDGVEIDEDAEEELQEAHDLISDQNEDGLDGFIVGLTDIQFEKIAENKMLEEALKEAGYQVESSNVSRSLYVINDENQEVRIADHKRPAFETIGGNYEDHQYENEMTVENNAVISDQLENFEIYVEKGSYYLG